ncbi:hypothetical protein HYC85_031679 [Camellia sinensis]|uniref:Uncharacterized protein n=1 Tax=Camellia sinensis TaxID=4442 RepID=A0A7J7FUU7_CAMSI|nr:hypothetical protein HYC85_031679 [Camellia sinensis]
MVKPGHFDFEEQYQQYHLTSGGSEILPSWVEQLYMEQEQMQMVERNGEKRNEVFDEPYALNSLNYRYGSVVEETDSTLSDKHALTKRIKKALFSDEAMI